MDTRYYYTGGVILALIALIIFSSISVTSAVGPSECDHRLDAKIIYLKVNSGKKTINVSHKHAASIDAKIEEGYLVKLSLLASTKDAIKGKGSVWITNTAYGFSSGTCIENVKVSSSGHGRVTVTVKDIRMGQAVSGLVQPVKWGSWPNPDQVRYDISWH